MAKVTKTGKRVPFCFGRLTWSASGPGNDQRYDNFAVHVEDKDSDKFTVYRIEMNREEAEFLLVGLTRMLAKGC